MRLDSWSRPTAAPTPSRGTDLALRAIPTRVLDVLVAATLLVVVAPLALLIALAIKIDSPGPVLYRSRRAGRHGVEFAMLKFRKMYDGAAGSPLTAANDGRFTRIGRALARTKLDELPQLVNVLMGEMSLVGPRPEDPRFVRSRQAEFDRILSVRPGITGLSQLAFAREPEILDPADRERDYEQRILPEKLRIDRLYSERRSFSKDLEILAWTVATVLFKRPVAVHRSDGRLTHRRRPAKATAAVAGHAGGQAG